MAERVFDLAKNAAIRIARLAAHPEALPLLAPGSIYCGTSTAASLLERSGWFLLETVLHDGQALGIYRKALG